MERFYWIYRIFPFIPHLCSLCGVGATCLDRLGSNQMRKSALLLAIVFAATAPTLAAAKSSKHVKHHARAAKAAPVAAAPTPADPNSAFSRALNDMFVGLGKTYPPKGGRGSGE